MNKCLTANQKITTICCVLLINKQLVELLFIKRWTVSEHQILQIITQNINYKLPIDYKFSKLRFEWSGRIEWIWLRKLSQAMGTRNRVGIVLSYSYRTASLWSFRNRILESIPSPKAELKFRTLLTGRPASSMSVFGLENRIKWLIENVLPYSTVGF